MSDGLTNFALARIAEVEELARKATGGPWHVEGESGEVVPWEEPWVAAELDIEVTKYPDGGQPNGSVRSYDDAAHIARWDPARILAECEAKRRLVEHVQDQWDQPYGEPEPFLPIEWTDVLKLLAQPYADHPDFRPEWRLEANHR